MLKKRNILEEICHLPDVLLVIGRFHALLCTQSYFWVAEILLLEDAIASPISKSTHTVVVGLEKEGDLNGKGFNRGTRGDGPVPGSDKGPEHPASPKHRSSSAPFKRC